MVDSIRINTPLHVCQRCMEVAGVPTKLRPVALLFDTYCDVCKHTSMLVHCVTDEHMDKLLREETKHG